MPAADRHARLEKVGTDDTSPGDSARAETLLPLAPDAVFAFIGEAERLFRLNPLLAIESWSATADGFTLAAHNESNDCRLTTRVRIDIDAAARTLSLHYDNGLKQRTQIRVEPAPVGARLVISDDYPRIDDPADPRVGEVDRSLVPWVGAIRRHLLARRRWGWLPGWRGWHERFLPSLSPRNRRIVRLLVWISLLEFLVFLGAVAVLRLAT